MIGYVLLTVVILIYIVSAVLQVRQEIQKRRTVDPLLTELAELTKKVTALEEKAAQIRTGLTAGDMNSTPANH